MQVQVRINEEGALRNQRFAWRVRCREAFPQVAGTPGAHRSEAGPEVNPAL
jgi:hypothetical protein